MSVRGFDWMSWPNVGLKDEVHNVVIFASFGSADFVVAFEAASFNDTMWLVSKVCSSRISYLKCEILSPVLSSPQL